MKFSISNFFSKCDQIRSFLRAWSYLLKKSVMENFIFCAVVGNRNNDCIGGRAGKGKLKWGWDAITWCYLRHAKKDSPTIFAW